MKKQIRRTAAAFALSWFFVSLALTGARAEDTIEKAGMGVGLTVGNVLFLPLKAISVSMGLINSSMSLIFTGNVDLAEQALSDTTTEPYYISPDLAKKAVGERPELAGKK